jgi:D-alanyl-D-alanine carboxypeptidase (penicillin-binding protein 5/6)
MPDPNHYSTARDLSTMAIAMIRDFPEDYKYYSEKEFTYNNIKQGNRNPLLYLNIGADGMKTGHTEVAGYGLIGSGKSASGRRVVFVLNGLESMEQRSTESAKILEWALKNFENKQLLKEGDQVGEVPVALGTVKSIPLVVKDNLAVTIPATSVNNFKVTANYKEPLIAPIKEGDKVGTVNVEVPNSEPLTFPLYAGASSEKIGAFAGLVDKAKRLFAGS